MISPNRCGGSSVYGRLLTLPAFFTTVYQRVVVKYPSGEQDRKLKEASNGHIGDIWVIERIFVCKFCGANRG